MGRLNSSNGSVEEWYLVSGPQNTYINWAYEKSIRVLEDRRDSPEIAAEV
jgi:hypothetical protein